MFVFETYDPVKNKTNFITGKNVIELCTTILNYKNKDIEESSDTDHTVIFSDVDRNVIIEISESGLHFALTGSSNSELNNNITDEMKNDSEKFWEITHANVKLIEFTNPVRMGEADWNENYVEDYDSDDESQDDLDDESNANVLNA